jgi:hypothetical protein
MQTIVVTGLACFANGLDAALRRQLAVGPEFKKKSIVIAPFWPVWLKDSMPTSLQRYGVFKISSDSITISYPKTYIDEHRLSRIQALKIPTSYTFPHHLDVDRSWIYVWVGPMFPNFWPEFPKSLLTGSSWNLAHEIGIYHEMLASPFTTFGNISYNSLISILAYIHQPQLNFLAACKKLNLNILAQEPNRPLEHIGFVDQKVYDYVIKHDRNWVKAKLSSMGIPFCELPTELINERGYTAVKFQRAPEDKIHVSSQYANIMATKLLKYICDNYKIDDIEEIKISNIKLGGDVIAPQGMLSAQTVETAMPAAMFPNRSQTLLLLICKPFLRLLFKKGYSRLCNNPKGFFERARHPVSRVLKMILRRLGPIPGDSPSNGKAENAPSQ